MTTKNHPTQTLAEGEELKTAAGPWMRIGTFTPKPDASYIVQGTLRRSVKLGSQIEADHCYAAEILGDPLTEWRREHSRMIAAHIERHPLSPPQEPHNDQ